MNNISKQALDQSELRQNGRGRKKFSEPDGNTFSIHEKEVQTKLLKIRKRQLLTYKHTPCNRKKEPLIILIFSFPFFALLFMPLLPPPPFLSISC